MELLGRKNCKRHKRIFLKIYKKKIKKTQKNAALKRHFFLIKETKGNKTMNIQKKIVGLFLVLATGVFANEYQTVCEEQKKTAAESIEKKLYQIQELIVAKLRESSTKLQEIQDLEIGIVNKWQHFLHVILPIQLEAIRQHGYEATQEGLSKFNEEYSKLSDRFEEFKKLNREKWQYIFEEAFGNYPKKDLCKEDLEAIASEIYTRVTSDEFLDKVKARMENLPSEMTLVERRKVLLEDLFSLKLQILSQFGLEGDEGYIQYARGMWEFDHDPQLQSKMYDAYHKLMRAANLIK